MVNVVEKPKGPKRPKAAKPAPPSVPAERLASGSGLAEHYSVSRARVYQWVNHPAFPAPVVMPLSHVKHWDIDEVEAWRRRNEG